jgi:hypothetical protein
MPAELAGGMHFGVDEHGREPIQQPASAEQLGLWW